MIHSASFFATGSDIAASVCVASAGLCLRTSSMTFSSASVSACEVDDVAATAAGAVGLRAAGRAACLRALGAGGGASGAAVAAGLVFLAAEFATGAAGLAVVLGTILRAIGRGFGNGTFGFAAAARRRAGNPIPP